MNIETLAVELQNDLQSLCQKITLLIQDKDSIFFKTLMNLSNNSLCLHILTPLGISCIIDQNKYKQLHLSAEDIARKAILNHLKPVVYKDLKQNIVEDVIAQVSILDEVLNENQEIIRKIPAFNMSRNKPVDYDGWESFVYGHVVPPSMLSVKEKDIALLVELNNHTSDKNIKYVIQNAIINIIKLEIKLNSAKANEYLDDKIPDSIERRMFKLSKNIIQFTDYYQLRNNDINQDVVTAPALLEKLTYSKNKDVLINSLAMVYDIGVNQNQYTEKFMIDFIYDIFKTIKKPLNIENRNNLDRFQKNIIDNELYYITIKVLKSGLLEVLNKYNSSKDFSNENYLDKLNQLIGHKKMSFEKKVISSVNRDLMEERKLDNQNNPCEFRYNLYIKKNKERYYSMLKEVDYYEKNLVATNIKINIRYEELSKSNKTLVMTISGKEGLDIYNLNEEEGKEFMSRNKKNFEEKIYLLIEKMFQERLENVQKDILAPSYKFFHIINVIEGFIRDKRLEEKMEEVKEKTSTKILKKKI